MLSELCVREETGGAVAAGGAVEVAGDGDLLGERRLPRVDGYCGNFCPKPGVVCEPPVGTVDADEKVCKIPLSPGLLALVEPEDYEELSQYKWFAGRSKHTYYACWRENNRQI